MRVVLGEWNPLPVPDTNGGRNSPWNTFPTIKDNQAFIIRFKDRGVITFANHNIMNGICDDCCDNDLNKDLADKKATEYQIITFEEE